MIARNLLKICLGFSELMALCALPFVLAQSDVVNDSDGDQGYEEVFSASGKSGWAYVNWEMPKGTTETNEFLCPWFLGAYRFNDGSLCVDLDRAILQTQNLVYAINYSCGRAGQSSLRSQRLYSGGVGPVPPSDSSDESAATDYSNLPSLYLYLRDTNWVILAESDDLLTSTNVARYLFISAEDGIESTNTVLLVNVPTLAYPNAAILQLRSENCSAPLSGAGDDGTIGTIIIREGLIFIADGSDLWSSDGQGNGATNYPGGNSLSNFYDWVTGNTNGTSTNLPGGGGGSGGGGGGDEPGGEEEDQKGKIFVDQGKGDDSFSGRLPNVAAGNKGPKKTCRSALSIAEPNDTIIIKSGNYNENLNISGKTGLKVIIAGNVRL